MIKQQDAGVPNSEALCSSLAIEEWIEVRAAVMVASAEAAPQNLCERRNHGRQPLIFNSSFALRTKLKSKTSLTFMSR